MRLAAAVLLCLLPTAVAEAASPDPMAYANAASDCTALYAIAAEAQAYRSSRWPEDQVAERLIEEYAYGPRGEVYRTSRSDEAVIRQLVDNVYAGRIEPAAAYTRCLAQARQDTQAPESAPAATAGPTPLTPR